MRLRGVVTAAVIVVAVPFVGGAVQAQQVLVGGVGFQSTPVLRATTSAEGQPISFPISHNQVVINYFTIAPGGESPRHSHPVTPIVYVLEGTLTMEVDGQAAKAYTAGQAFVESVNVWHKAANRGTAPVKAIIVYTGEEGKPFTVNAP
jgi:quercetin dioxygenase-like cupin family protein